jgi:hypothetical protein
MAARTIGRGYLHLSMGARIHLIRTWGLYIFRWADGQKLPRLFEYDNIASGGQETRGRKIKIRAH